MENQLSLSDVIGALKRRWKPALAAFLLVFIVSLLYAVLASPVYRSSSTILIEQQEIPQDLVRSTVTSYADQRIQMIIQRVMTFARLSELIKKYDLYKDEREKNPLEVVIETMKKDIGQKMISADVVDPRSGRPTEATIAFSLSYQSQSPKLAQQVAGELTTLFLNENIRTRTEMAEEAEVFLSEEVRRLERKSRELEGRLAEFKENNLRMLPEMTAINMNIIDRSERELFDLNRQIQAMEERKINLESQLSQISPRSSIVTGDYEQVLSPQARAKVLQNQLIALSASYTDQHPDVLDARRELDEIISEGHLPNDALFLRKQIEIYQALLLKSSYVEDFSANKRAGLERKIALLEEKLSGVADEQSVSMAEADNPIYIQSVTSLQATNSDLKHLKKSRKELKDKISQLESALLGAPGVEKEYRQLSRDYENTSLKYRELKEKQLQASLAKTLEDEGKGERFTLIEPPLLSQTPVKPNRLLIVAAGLFGALFLSGFLVVVLEKTDTTLYSVSAIKQMTGSVPLATIPHIATTSDERQRKKIVFIALMSVSLILVVMTVSVHIAVMPLDVLWYTVLRKIS